MTIKFSHARHALALAAVLACTLTGVSLARAADDDLVRYKKAEEIAKVQLTGSILMPSPIRSGICSRRAIRRT
jgi:hypothetical protein